MTDILHSFIASPARSRSSSTGDAPSPDSFSSDSHSSSDPDIHLTTLSSSWSSSPPLENPKHFGDYSISADRRCFEFDSPMSFSSSLHSTVHPFQSPNYDMDDIILTPQVSSDAHPRTDMLKLEELLDDASFEQPISVPPALIYPSYLPNHHGPFLQPGNKEIDNPFSILVNTGAENQGILDLSKEPSRLDNNPEPLLSNQQQAVVDDCSSPSPSPPPSNVPQANPLIDTTDLSSTLTSSSSLSSFPPALSPYVVYPPKEVCNSLPIFFPSIPPSGTKSRVETQIKLAFELAIPLSISSAYSSTYIPISSSNHPQQIASSSTSNFQTGSPSPHFTTLPLPSDLEGFQRPPTHDRVGTYKYLRLPTGTVTKRRSANPATAKKEAKVYQPAPEEMLQMTADVVCSSPPYMSVQSCESCQAREAKRTARKLAARVRPAPGARPKSKSKGPGKKGNKRQDSEGEDQLEAMEEDYEEPNVDDSILQFNCGDTLSFSTGSVVLPMRITCYCRHHKEKIGFNIVFTLTDYLGRVVGRGTTPPILITDDHKSVNAVSKLPPMHPLRQNLNATSLPLVSSSSAPAENEPLAITNENSQPHSQLKRRDQEALKKRRPKPYDGRPPKPGNSLSNLDGRPGVVLALHPAHARKHTEGIFIQNSLPGTRSPTPSEPTFIPISQSMNGTHYDEGSPSLPPGTPYQLSPRLMPSSVLSTPVLSQGQSGSSGSPLQSFSPEHQQFFDAKALYPTFSFPMEPPRIHRLIPSSGPTTGGIEITVLGSNFNASLPLECVFGGVVASSTHRWSDNTLVCLLPPRATPGAVSVEVRGVPPEIKQDGAPSFFHYVDESDRQLMELALQVVGLKMTGKIEEARNVAMRIVGQSSPRGSMGDMNQMNTSSDSYISHSMLGSLTGVDLESLVIKLLTLIDVPLSDDIKFPQASRNALDHKNATGQTLLHLAAFLALPSLVSCIIGRGADVNARNNNGITPLHFAVLIGWKEGVEILLSEGADATIVDRMGCTAADRARLGAFNDIENVLRIAPLSAIEHDNESGAEGDDEGYQSDDNESEDEKQPSTRFYKMGSRTASSSHLQTQDQDDSAKSEAFHHPKKDADVIVSDNDMKKPASRPGTPRGRSFVKRLQRKLPQNILPHVQIPGIQLRDMPWNLSQIPVFPIYVPLMPWLNVPRTEDVLTDDKKGDLPGTPGEKHQQHSLAALWAAYDNGWRNQWEKWSAFIMAMQTASNNSTVESELPPYSPRQPEEVVETKDVKNNGPTVDSTPALEQAHPLPLQTDTVVVATENKPPAPRALSSIAKGARRLGYRSRKVPENEVAVAHHHKPKRQSNKQDRMLVLFWIPILIIGIAYALYTILPTATRTVFQGTKLMSHKLLQ